MADLKIPSPQQMLEDAFRAMYKEDKKTESARVEAEGDISSYQIQWCNNFQEVFSFVSQYGGRICLNMHDDFEVKFFHYDKCSVTVVSESGGYSIEVHPPAPNSDKCHCIESYIYDMGGNKVLFLTLPEITQHISKGLAKSNADNKRTD